MTIAQKQNRGGSGTGKAREVRKLVVKPLARRIDRHAGRSFRLGRRILKRVKQVEESIEIIARHIARQLRNG